MNNQDICEEMYYDGEPQKLIEALISSKLLDKSEEHRLIVHDWEKHCDQAIRRKLQRHNKKFCLVMTSHNSSSPVMTILPSGTGSGSGSGSSSITKKCKHIVSSLSGSLSLAPKSGNGKVHPDEIKMVLQEGRVSSRKAEDAKAFWDKKFKHYLNIDAVSARRIIGAVEWKKIIQGAKK